ncbi:hypothetical protein AB7Z54_21440 [Providencia manganoxydans]|uniref:hypothetical protein n=1 Tax=Providencia manganoxydans TaxID=2923283 RepID=UPI002949DD1D|nr:hypothetical protein [Providencia rettgeri]
MKKKVIRLVSQIDVNETKSSLIYEQKMSLIYFLFGGWFSFFFMKKKGNRTVCFLRDINSIDISSTVMTGNLITVNTNDIRYVLEARNKKTWVDICKTLPSILPNIIINEKK